MTALRLIADDLTGALDSAAQFTGAGAPVTVLLDPEAEPAAAGNLAIDTATRDRPKAAALAAVASAATRLRGAGLAFKKIDSLLRGPFAEELALCLELGGFRSCIVAPAFPAQHRVTRDGRQLWRAPSGAWQPTACDLTAALSEAGLAPRPAARPDRLSGSGVFVCDAECAADLAAIAAAGRALDGPLLWCGSAGLAAALAGQPAAPAALGPQPLLLVVGSRHPVMLDQLARLRDLDSGITVALPEGDAAAALATLERRLQQAGRALVTFELPDGLAEAEAAGLIAGRLRGLVQRCPRPASLFVSGGETLRALCEALAVERLEVVGEVAAGLPASRLVGGRWDGLPLVSKSGAFGGPALLAELIGQATPARRSA
ncbi:Uncharacterized conserved protein YgbK, DUF1537 family [Tistlia consotensis]|uniref:Uncharacterized conserved protein YgbK, DUF1537 family n=1 Tax=Tistlia consotensis USBA 355 TaxID=560819 RepID=A0A1Y6CKE0_9PROT|nr:four-carbon acid sugar kinase family protein [Tistlia consotensis]SMF69065.1 Uncharacterized conserved protein YgbK, DUF1537 family [Tistlia consotensis USBA 355]SNS01734.1 Uncharacterized conserved protein YgbK, DUF1537 family [Tistlia consotensis]